MMFYVLIPTYKSSNFLNKNLESILNQNIENLKIIVGIDGCIEKYDYIKEIEYYYSNENVGTYIMSNSLIKLVPNQTDNIIMFDSDDYMPSNFLKPCIDYYSKLPKNSILKLNLKNCYDNNFFNLGKLQHGIKTIITTKFVFSSLGGYGSHRVAQDTFFAIRAKRKYKIYQNLSLPYFIRIVRPESLSQAKDTKYKSNNRTIACEESNKKIKNNIIIEDFVSVELNKKE